jgi:MFS family permease
MDLPLLKPLADRNFLLLWGGSLISYVGAQLTLIAFPWLILKLTGDALIMGTVLAVAGVPRAIFMLFGGALTDRFSARSVMLWVNFLRMILMFGLAWLVYSNLVEVWMIFVIAFLFGIIDAFYFPASAAIVPKILPASLLPPGNALLQGIGQLSVMTGPVLAGFIIAMFADEAAGDAADLPGIAFVFFVDAVGYVIAAIGLFFIRIPSDDSTAGNTDFDLMASIREGILATWNDLPLRLIIIIFTTFSLFFRGPYMVGIPVLCDVRFEEGALAFGMIGSAFGVGSLVGLVAAGSLPRLPERFYGWLIIVDLLVISGGFFVYAWTPDLEWALLASALAGLTDGYLVILIISWLQIRIPAEVMGRVMSVLMFCLNGVVPVSAAAAGWVIQYSLVGVFQGAGTILIALTLLGALSPTLRHLGMNKESNVEGRAI